MIFDWFKRLKKKQTLEQAQQTLEETNERTNEQTHDNIENSSVELHKESLQIGLAAGYTGRSIHDINESLNRIETLLPTRDWLLVQFEKHFSDHESNEQRRLEAILNALESISKLSLDVPEPIRSEIQSEVNNIKNKLATSDRMNELIELVRQNGEISYADAAARLTLTPSGFRSLVSDTKKRTDEITTVDHGDKKKKFLHYVGKTSVSSA